MPERLMRETAGHRAPHHALGTTLPTPRIGLDDATLDDRPLSIDPLADGFEAELVEAAEGGQAGRSEGSVEHVEVFRW